MRVLTYNIHGGRGTDGRRDYARIGQLLKDLQIDVALLQEFDARDGICTPDEAIFALKTDHFLDFVPAPTIQQEKGWYGNALLTRFPVKRLNIVDISAPGREPRNILEVFVQTEEGPLHIVNTHKGLGLSERGAQMRVLNDMLVQKSGIPLIVGGDINEWHTYSGALRKLNRLLHPLPTGLTFPTLCPLFRLDRLWCRPRELIVRCRVLRTAETRVYSDHYPLLAEIESSTILEASARESLQ